jgi:hypothetical protein
MAGRIQCDKITTSDHPQIRSADSYRESKPRLSFRAAHAGDATSGKMQHLLERAKWDTMAVMAAVRGFVCERLDDRDAVAILDESGQCKKGTATVGVKRQYVGRTRRNPQRVRAYRLSCTDEVSASTSLAIAPPWSWGRNPGSAT